MSFSGSDAPSGSVTRTFDVTVKGDPGLVERELAMVRQKLDDSFTLDNLSYISSADGDFDPQRQLHAGQPLVYLQRGRRL